MFLGSEPSGVQSYTLIGDRSSTVHVATVYPNHSINLLDPSSPIQTGLLIEQADLIAKGLSRFSFLPPWSVDAGPFVMLPTETLKALPGQLGVECQPSPDDNRVVEVVLASLVANPTAAFQSVKIDSTIHFQAILNCDYGNATSYRTISTASKNNGWRVRSKFPFTHPIITFLEGTSNLRLHMPAGAVDGYPWFAAVRNDDLADSTQDPFRPEFQFTDNETALPVSRGFQGWQDFDGEGVYQKLLRFEETSADRFDGGVTYSHKSRVGGEYDWQYGRRVRDGMTFRLGHMWWYKEDNATINAPHPGSFEFQVEHSLLTGPGATDSDSGKIEYTLSSWSQNCPFFDSDKKEISVIAAANDPNISGCVIDFSLWCTSRFPEDVDLDAVTTLEQPTCSIFDFDVTLLSGDIIVDPYMLVSADLVSSFFVDVLFTNISSHLCIDFLF
jgi:hypothetical protein